MGKDIKTLFMMIGQLKYILTAKQKKRSILLFGIVMIGALFETLGVSAILPFIQAIMTPEELMKNRYISVFVQFFGITDENTLVFLMAGLLVILYVVKNSYLTFSVYQQIRFRFDILKDLSTKMLHSYMKRPYTFFLNTNSASMLRGINEDVFGAHMIIDNIFKILSELLTIIMIGGFLIYKEPFMAVSILILAYGCFLFVTIIFKKRLSVMGEKIRDINALKGRLAYQAITGNKEIKVMHRAGFFVRAYEEAYEGSRKIDVKYAFIGSLPERIIETVCIGGLMLVICIRMGMKMNGNEFIPNLAIFGMAAFRILPSISRMTGYLNALVYYRPTLEALSQTMRVGDDYDRELEDHKQEYAIVEETESAEERFKESLHINNITWAYSESNDYVLKDLSLTIHKGESVALIGMSGAGKTTLADVILGLLNPESGTVKMDGRNVFAFPEQWSKIIGYVPQVTFLIDETIRANVAFGLEKKEIEDVKIWKALEQAQLKEFVEKLPKGLDTIAGERGVKFSGGQRQRIAIARALYCDPDILVLDEATSALDNETEEAIMEAIEALRGHKTLIIVAHRLTTIKKCDKIYEIIDGKACLRAYQDVFRNQ